MSSASRRPTGDGGVARILALLLLAFVAAPAAGAEDEGAGLAPLETGPLRTRDQFVLGVGSLAFEPAGAGLLPPGAWQMDVVLSAANHFARSAAVGGVLDERPERRPLTLEELRGIGSADPRRGVFLVDGEQHRAAVTLRRGVREHVELQVMVPVVDLDGGFLDTIIEDFHDAFSVSQMGRLGVPRNLFLVYVGGAEGEFFTRGDSGLALGDVVLGARLRLLPEEAASSFLVAAETLIKLPTGSPERLAGSGSLDAGIQVLVTRSFPSSRLHGSLGLRYLGEMESLAVPRQALLSGTLAFEQSLGSKTSILGQVALSQSPFDHLALERLAEPLMEITLGLKRTFGPQVVFLAVTENVRHFNNSSDIGFHVGLTRRF